MKKWELYRPISQQQNDTNLLTVTENLVVQPAELLAEECDTPTSPYWYGLEYSPGPTSTYCCRKQVVVLTLFMY